MKNYYRQYKPFLIFLAKFFSSYLLFTLLYNFYLSGFEGQFVDGITAMVAQNTQQLLGVFGFEIELRDKLAVHSISILYQNVAYARIIEGCNAISITILFVSFVFSFTGKVLKMIFFIVSGVVSIYVFNIMRIALFVYLLVIFPDYVHFLHQIVFPLAIYGFVFFLWVVWVTKFSIYAKKDLE